MRTAQQFKDDILRLRPREQGPIKVEDHVAICTSGRYFSFSDESPEGTDLLDVPPKIQSKQDI